LLSAKGAAFTTRLGRRTRVDRSSTSTSAEGAIQFWRYFVEITGTALISADDMFGIESGR